MALTLGVVATSPAASLAQGVVLQPAPPTQAAPQLPVIDPDATLVEELVVVARDRGPAWWTVSNGTSTVYVLGAPSLAPKRTPWDLITLQRRLNGASQVILPFQEVKVQLAGSVGAAWNLMRLRTGKPFEEGLDPAGRARFAAAREKIGQPAGRYKTNNALAAGLLLAGDYRDHSNLTNADTAKVVRAYAQMAKVPVVQKSYDIGPLMGAILRTPKPAARACLDAVLEQVEAGPGVTVAAAKAWAEGDTPGALDNERTYERCINMVPGAQTFDARTKADQVAAIEKALKAPGHAIAVVHLRPLLAQGGVLDQLRAKGYEVKTPGEV
ncbi:TraB/GumN family protein [Phenylobacterium sp. LjRoot225]|uniref:TraB/GumN family protein n=1 Tax=Phenylobacterium sp. LjRoot225 TaxID=3342285 RepID=UPI003ECD9B18